MREINKISEALFEKIRDRFEEVSLGDENAKATQNPEDARFFNFDYVVDNHNHGNITLSVIDETSLKVYFSKNISKDLDPEHKKEWFAFLRELREFAKRNILSFEPRDITRSTLKHRDIQQVSRSDDTYTKDDVVAESRMYGTLNRSYESFGPVRIKLQHSKPIMDETLHGVRSRNIAAVFVENDQGERFRLPFNNLSGARAMARHVSAGGVPTDELGCHITEMVNEMLTLRPFVRGMHRRTFEDVMTTEMVESAFGYHGLLKNTLKKMKGKRGYTEYKESYKPALVEDDANVEELKELFVKKTLDERIEQALPLVHKAYNIMKENNNKFAQQFESWAESVAEGTWSTPDVVESGGDTPVSCMTRKELLSYLHSTEKNAEGLTDDALRDAANEKSQEYAADNMSEGGSEFLYKKLRQGRHGSVDVLGYKEAPSHSVLSGQVLKHFIDNYKNEEEALRAHPDAEEYSNAYTDPQVSVSHLPGEDDPVPGGMYPDDLKEGTWHLPEQSDVDTLIELLGEELPVGVDAINAINAVEGIIGDDNLIDDLQVLAEVDPAEDARDTILGWLQSESPNIYQAVMNEIGDLDVPEETAELGGDLDESNIHNEDPAQDSREAAQSAIIRRIINSHKDLLKHYGPEAITNAVEEYAYNLDDLQEIGSSDVSGWVNDVIDLLGEWDLQKQDDKEMYQQHYAGNDSEPDPHVRNTEFEESFQKLMGEEEYCDACDHTMDQCICEGHDDYVNKDEKLKRMGAKPLSFMDKLKTIPQGAKAFVKGDPEDDLTLYNKSKFEETQDMPLDPPGYAKRVAELEAEGMTTSDAQGVADYEHEHNKGPWAEKVDTVSEMRRLAGLK